MALQYRGRCMGGPYHGQEWVYFSNEMDVTIVDGNPLLEIPFKIKGTYKHDGKELWVWFGQSCG